MNILYTSINDNLYLVKFLSKPTSTINKYTGRIESKGILSIESNEFNFPSINDNTYYTHDFTIITYDEQNIPYKSFTAIQPRLSSVNVDENIYDIDCDWVEEYLL